MGAGECGWFWVMRCEERCVALMSVTQRAIEISYKAVRQHFDASHSPLRPLEPTGSLVLTKAVGFTGI